jgi:molecular chaperone DnaK
MPQIEVGFDIDANGIVNVSAKDKATGKEQQIQIKASGGLSEDDISRMVNEADQHAAEDKARREAVEARNQADSLIYATEKSLEEHGDKLGEDDRTAIDTALADLKTEVEKDDADATAIAAKTEALNKASMKLGEVMYAQATAEAAEAGAEGAAASNGTAAEDADDGTVYDADFEEVQEDDSKDRPRS